MSTFQSLFISALVLVLSACSGGGGGGGLPSTGGGGPGGGGTTGGTSSYGLQKGTYEMACQQPGYNGSANVVVGQTTYSMSELEYDSSTTGCSQLATVKTLQYTATSPGASSAVSGATDLDLTFVKLTMKPLTATAVNTWNSSSECGLTNWTINTEVDVTATSCNTGAGAHYYTIAKLVNDTLQIGFSAAGSADDGSTSSKRNSAIAPLDFFKK